MKNYLIILMTMFLIGCPHSTNDKSSIINKHKDVLLSHNNSKKHNFSIGDSVLIELSDEGFSRIMPLENIAFYDKDTKKILFSYSKERLLNMRKGCKKGHFILTQRGLEYVKCEKIR